MSIANSEDAQDVDMDDSQLSGRNNNQRATNDDDSQSLESNDKNGSEDDDEGDGHRFPDPIPFSPDDTSQTSSNIKSPDSAVPRHFSAFTPNSRPSNIGPHRNSSRKSSVTNSPMKAPNRVGSQSASSGGLHNKLSKALDPASREERDEKNGLVRFYSMQMRDTNKTNEKLQDKILELQSGNQKRVNDLQEKVTDLQEKLTKLKIKNQALKSCIEFMQMQPGRYSAHQGFHSQPPPFQNALSFSASLTSAHVPQGPSHGDFDPSLKNDFFPLIHIVK
jgi:hypothetical protein